MLMIHATCNLQPHTQPIIIVVNSKKNNNINKIIGPNIQLSSRLSTEDKSTSYQSKHPTQHRASKPHGGGTHRAGEGFHSDKKE
jgi:hypothetical protein